MFGGACYYPHRCHAHLPIYYKGKLSNKVMVASVLLLCFADLWSVDKDTSTMPNTYPRAKGGRGECLSDIDKIILADSTQHRVLNLTVNTLNDATNFLLTTAPLAVTMRPSLQRYQTLLRATSASGTLAYYVCSILSTSYTPRG